MSYYHDYNSYLTNRGRAFSKHTFNFLDKSPTGLNAYIMDVPIYNENGGNLTTYKPSNPAYAIQGPTTSSIRISRLSSISRDCNYRIFAPIKQENPIRKSVSSIYRCKGLISSFGDAMGKC